MCYYESYVCSPDNVDAKINSSAMKVHVKELVVNCDFNVDILSNFPRLVLWEILVKYIFLRRMFDI